MFFLRRKLFYNRFFTAQIVFTTVFLRRELFLQPFFSLRRKIVLQKVQI